MKTQQANGGKHIFSRWQLACVEKYFALQRAWREIDLGITRKKTNTYLGNIAGQSCERHRKP
jgi:hypothetical protein